MFFVVCFGLLAQASVNGRQALSFPKVAAVSNYVELHPDFSEAQDELSICSWLKSSTNEDYNYWFSYATSTHDNSILLRVDATQYFRTTTSESSLHLDVTLVKNVWYHHCFSWKSGEANFYINGMKIKYSGTAPAGKIILGGKLILGQEQDSLGGYFDVTQAFRGEMLNLNVFKKKLSLEEVTGMFVGGRCADLALSLSYEVVLSWDDIMNSDLQGEVKEVDAGCSTFSDDSQFYKRLFSLI